MSAALRTDSSEHSKTHDDLSAHPSFSWLPCKGEQACGVECTPWSSGSATALFL